MIKQVKAVKVYWNDDCVPRASFYPNMESALAAVMRALPPGGSASNITLKETVRLINTENDHDMSWYSSHVGKTCSDPAENAAKKNCGRKTKAAAPVRFIQPELPIQVNPIRSVAKTLAILPAVQKKLRKPRAAKTAFGDTGYTDTYNPERQRAGRIGGSSIHNRKPKAKSHDRRPHGTVNVANMTVNQHREYWRWVNARKCARKAGVTPPRWDAWRLRASC